MSNVSFFDLERDRLRTTMAEFGHRWGWYFALGTFLVILGTVITGTTVTATLLSVVVLGSLLLVAGVGLVFLSFLTGKWSGFMMTLAAGVLSGITGITLLRAPLSGAAALTLVVASFLLVAGLFRTISSIVMRFPNWGWSMLSGIVSVGLGALLIQQWPVSGLWFLGLYLGIDLIVHGFSWIMFSLKVHGLARALDVREEERRAA